MLVGQGGVCAICRQPEQMRKNGQIRALSVDHDHETGTVRGLLCGHCNSILGLAKDSVDRLSRAIDYLQQQIGAGANGVSHLS